MSLAPPGYHCRNRMFEWLMASSMIWMAITMFAPGNSLGAGAFRNYHLSETFEMWAGIVIGGVGLLRIAALYLNGRWPVYGPICRVVAASIGATIWCVLLSTLLLNSIIDNVMSLGIPLYAHLLIGELVSVRRSSIDSHVR